MMRPSMIVAILALAIAASSLVSAGVTLDGFGAGCAFSGLALCWWRLRMNESESARWARLAMPHYDNDLGRLESDSEADLRFSRIMAEVAGARLILSGYATSDAVPRDQRFVV